MRVYHTNQHNRIWYIKYIRYKLFYVFTSLDHAWSFIDLHLVHWLFRVALKKIIFKVIFHFRSLGNLLHMVVLDGKIVTDKNSWHLVYKRAQGKKGQKNNHSDLFYVSKFCCHTVFILPAYLYQFSCII